jgi:hypothetical protein
MVVWDIDGNSANDPVELRVIEDLDAPSIDSPPDFSYITGETGNLIVWTVSDANPSWYQVTRQEAILDSGDWFGARVTFNVDGLSEGSYSFTLTVYDGAGNMIDDTVVVTVVPPTPDEPAPPPPLDWGFIGLVIASIGGMAVVIVVIVLFLKKRKPY